MGSGWVDGEGGLGWATPVGAALTPFLINGAGSTNASVSCGAQVLKWWEGESMSGHSTPVGLVPVISKRNPEGWTHLPAPPFPIINPHLKKHTTAACSLAPLAASLEVPKVQGEGYPGFFFSLINF